MNIFYETIIGLKTIVFVNKKSGKYLGKTKIKMNSKSVISKREEKRVLPNNET